MAKKVTVAEFEKWTKNAAGPNEVTVEFDGITVQVKKFINMANVIGMVETVIASCVNKETGEYIPYVMDYALRSEFVERYTNLTLPADTERRYYLLCATDLFENLVSYVNHGQFASIMRAIKDGIDDALDVRNADIERRVSDILAGFERLSNMAEGLFSGIDADAINGMVGAITDGKLDERKLVDAYFDRKEDSDASASDIHEVAPDELVKE